MLVNMEKSSQCSVYEKVAMVHMIRHSSFRLRNIVRKRSVWPVSIQFRNHTFIYSSILLLATVPMHTSTTIMPCNPKQKASAYSPIQQLLREIAAQLDLHQKQVEKYIMSIQKVVVETLLFDTPLSTVDVEALELEAETAMEDSAAIMVSYKADLDKLPVPVLVNVLTGAYGSVCTLVEVQPLATELVAKETEQYESYIKVFKILKAVCEEGKKIGWVKFRDDLVAKYGVEKLKGCLIWQDV